jgi:hypothetical protein
MARARSSEVAHSDAVRLMQHLVVPTFVVDPTHVPGDDVGSDWFLGQADQPLYAAKRLGRNRVISAETMLADFARLHPRKIAPPNPARTAQR